MVISYQTKKAKTSDKFKLDKGDYTKLKEFLNLNWDKMLDPSKFSIDEMWEKFKLIMLEGMNKFTPRCGRRDNTSKKNFQPYNRDLHQLIHRKYRLWKRWIRTRDVNKFTEYKTVRNAVKRETVKLVQLEKEKNSIECKSNTKKNLAIHKQTRICAAEMAVRYAALCRKVHVCHCNSLGGAT